MSEQIVPPTDPIPQNVLEALLEVRNSGLTNMFGRSTVIELCSSLVEDYAAADWLLENKSRYMEALNAMGEMVND